MIKLDLGSDHWLEWGQNRDGEIVSAIVTHKRQDGEGYCPGSIAFKPGYGPPVWTVESWDPLTLSPSLLCHCGDHGWIRNGRWVSA